MITIIYNCLALVSRDVQRNLLQSLNYYSKYSSFDLVYAVARNTSWRNTCVHDIVIELKTNIPTI